MSVRIPLPRYDRLPEGVYFHKEDPSDPYSRIVLQVPNAERTDSESYVLDLSTSEHRCWVEGLPNSRNLLTTLAWAHHVAFETRTGHFEEMPDLDAPTEVAKIVAKARSEAAGQQAAGRLHQAHRRRQNVLPPSKLRQALSGRRWR